MTSSTFVALLAMLAGAPARAAPREGDRGALRTQVVGRCPSSVQLGTALALFLPSREIVAGTGAGRAGSTGAERAAVEITVTDLGPRYRVEVAGLQKVFEDGKRRCDERARAAAVFAALTIEPPVPSTPPRVVPPPIEPPPVEPPPVEPKPSPPPPPVAPSPPAVVLPSPPPAPPVPASAGRRRPLRFELELAPQFAFAPRTSDATVLGGGGALRLVGGWPALGFAIGVTGLSPFTLGVGKGDARIIRVPVDLDVRLSLRLPEYEAYVELGYSLAALVAASTALTAVGGDTFSESGLRLAVGVRVLATRRFWPFVGAEFVLVPDPLDVRVNGRTVASTPYFWLGASLGIAWKID